MEQHRSRAGSSLGILAIAVCSGVAGAVFGPVALAAYAAAFAPATGFNGQVIEASKLVEAYRAELKPSLLFLSLAAPGDGAECGYDPDVVLPNGIEALVGGKRNSSYVDYEGYYALNQWRSQQRDEAWIAAIIEEVDDRMSPFEAGFLRRCIEGTIFKKLCMKKVEQFGEMLPRFDRKQKVGLMAEGDEDRVVCTFLDGIAARKGIPLSSPRKMKE